LTHDALAALPRSSGVTYLRELLMTTGLLPQRNHDLLEFDEWTSDILDQTDATDDRQALATYIKWHHRHRILRKSTTAPCAHRPGTPRANKQGSQWISSTG
jgi:hypothetical protein